MVFFPARPDDQSLTPGSIEQIFELENTTYFAIHQYLSRVPSFFDSYQDFGASVWEVDIDPLPTIVKSGPRIYNANQRGWGERQVVMRPLVEVSSTRSRSSRIEAHGSNHTGLLISKRGTTDAAHTLGIEWVDFDLLVSKFL